MGYLKMLGMASGSPSYVMSYEVWATGYVTVDAYWWGGPGVAQASLSYIWFAPTAKAQVVQAGPLDAPYTRLDQPAVYSKDLQRATFVVNPGYSTTLGQNGSVSALLNVLAFPPNTLIGDKATIYERW